MGKIDEMVAERKMQKGYTGTQYDPKLLKRLSCLRQEQHKRLLDTGIVRRITNLGLLGEGSSPDDFYIVRRSPAMKITDNELAANPALAHQFDVFAGIINDKAIILQMQRLEPIGHLDQYDRQANIASLGVIACTSLASKEMLRLDIDGIPHLDMTLVENLIHELDTAADVDNIPIDKDYLVSAPPIDFIQPGIPLV